MNTMFGLPCASDTEGLDACFVGVPFDAGTATKTGSKLAPTQIRVESDVVRPFNQDTGADPHNSIRVADVGNIACSPFDIREACKTIKEKCDGIVKGGCRPIVLGGDRTITYPILQSMKEKHGPVGMIQIDAHCDTSLPLFGSEIWHGSPFRLAVDEGLLDCHKVWQIGIRGSAGSITCAKWGQDKGFNVVPAFQLWYKSLAPLMRDVREKMGNTPVYLTIDIDGLDPSIAPGTGVPELGGLTSTQALEVIRGCRGLNVVGGDLVEVSPPHDLHNITSTIAAHLLFEMLCILPGVEYKETAFSPAYRI
ncbi:hypothetical protein CAPTEDRAFT_183154 [Capitella teleta]|uniref:Agmatinase n=1 Tax=Capitella teleta TaxID=283909 RepID=R7U7L0_CAPTE|nr:hypothetical protein CAPTEDRAFT_183154 [Capitella teleta]|eukprot:ELT99130.1 hypothetical protein CAPTEDRAFT_183154 [Capitella teleta]